MRVGMSGETSWFFMEMALVIGCFIFALGYMQVSLMTFYTHSLHSGWLQWLRFKLAQKPSLLKSATYNTWFGTSMFIWLVLWLLIFGPAVADKYFDLDLPDMFVSALNYTACYVLVLW
jgi:hypothetical protein